MDSAKFAQLIALRKPHRAKYLKVEWAGGAVTKYYATSAYSRVSPYRGVKTYTGGEHIEARLIGDPLNNFEINGDLRAENIQIPFSDQDGEIKALFKDHGAAKASIHFYYPQIDEDENVWWGQLLPPEVVGRHTQLCRLTNGYRSPEEFLPNGLTPKECPATFGGKLDSLDKVRTNLCPYDIHLPGGTVGNLDPATGQPYIDCPKLTKADSIARLGTDRYFAGTELNAQPYPVDNPGNLAFSKGNANSRNKPVTWIFGTKYYRGGELLIWRRELNQNHPDEGFVRAVFRVSEGLNHALSDIKVIDRVIAPIHYNARLGHRGQGMVTYQGMTDNFSGRSVVNAVYGPVDPQTVTAQSLTVALMVLGNAEVAVYVEEEENSAFARQFSNDRVWSLLEMYTNQKCGRKYDADRFWIEDYFTASEWTRKSTTLTLTFPDGEEHTYAGQRTQFDAAVEGRPAVEVIKDVCRSGRLSVPFQDDGKYTIKPFRVFTEDELDDAIVFYDSGPNVNIHTPKDGQPVTFMPMPDDKLINEITLTFEEATNFDIARPIKIEDPDQKARASKLLGDESFLTVQAQYSAFGVRNLNEAVKLGHYLLRFGEFETGGIWNNCPARHIVPATWLHGLQRYGPYRFSLTTMEAPTGPTGTAQIITATGVGTASGSGNITITITAAGLSVSPIAVAIASGDTPAVWIGKVKTALKLNSTVNAFFFIKSSGADLILKSRSRAANDLTMNVAIAAGTTGITADPTSTITTTGVADAPFEWFRCLGIKAMPGALAEITGIAYNRTASEAFEVESVIDPPPPGQQCSITVPCPEGFECINGVCEPIEEPPICRPNITANYNSGTGMIELDLDDC